MPMTSDSGQTSYCDPATFLAFIDSNYAGDLVRDDGTRAMPEELLTDAVLAAALSSASGDVEMACIIGDRYKPEDLAALTGNALKILQRMVAQLTIGVLRDRRGVVDPPDPMVERARASLEQLKTGTMLFPFKETEAASLPNVSPYTDGDFAQLNLMSRMTRFFGMRSSFQPRGYD